MSLLPIASKSGSFLITPNVGLMVWVLVVFAISLAILAKWVFPLIGAALDRRQQTINASLDAAEQSRRQADELLGEYRERLAEARQQAEDILARAHKAAEAQERRAKEESEAKRQEELERTRREIEAEGRRAIAEIRREVAELTVEATERLMRKSLSEQDQRRLVQEALDDLDFDALTAGGAR